MKRVLGILMAFAVLAVAFTALVVIAPAAEASHVAPTIPSPPKTPEQMAAEAYALEADVRAAAGRKTDPTDDGVRGTAPLQTQTDTLTSDFAKGTHNSTTTDNDAVRLAEVTGDNFDDNLRAPFWSYVYLQLSTNAPCTVNVSCIREAGQEVNISYGEVTTSYEVQNYIYTTANPANDTYKTSILETAWVRSALANFTITDSYGGYTPLDGQNLSDHRKLWVMFDTTGAGVQRVVIKYINNSGVVSVWKNGTSNWDESDALWGQVVNVTGCSYNCWVNVTVGKDATNYYVQVNRASDSLLIANATINRTFVRNDNSIDYIVIGDETRNGRNAYGVGTEIYRRLDNWTLEPAATPASGEFTSRAISFGEWDALGVKGTFSIVGAVPVDYRFANNSNMSGASTWASLTNDSDFSASNFTGGFWQYRATLDVVSERLNDFTWTYRSYSHGTGPSKDIHTEMKEDSAWVRQNVTLSGKRIYLNLTDVDDLGVGENYARILWMNNSIIDWTVWTTSVQVTNFFVGTNFMSNFTFEIRISNSTVRNFGNFSTFGVSGVSADTSTMVVRYYLDNATLDTFNTFPLAGTCGGNWDSCSIESIHDSQLTEYNKGDSSYSALNRVETVTRIKASNPTARTTGGIVNNVRNVSYSMMEGGFNQLVFQSAAVGPGYPVEYLNWSSNYIANSTHTAMGVYGINPSANLVASLSAGYYATLYRNFINDSRYIQIQTGGNLSNLRVIGNYQRGPAPSFSEAMGFNWHAHDLLVEGNYIWDMNSTNNRGIVMDSFNYNVTVRNNVIFDVGVFHIDIENMGLKYINATGAEYSDYSYKGMNITFENNYLSGAYYNPAWYQNSGYIRAFNNTIVNVGPGKNDFNIFDGWDCTVNVTCDIDSFAWLDWHDGYANISNTKWTPTDADKEDMVWIRYFRGSDVRTASLAADLTVDAPPHWPLNYSGSFGFGELGPGNPLGCLDGPASMANITVYAGGGCQPGDNPVASFNGNQRLLHVPYTWHNKTVTVDMQPTITVSGLECTLFQFYEIRDLTLGTAADIGCSQWSPSAGHDYEVALLTRTVQIAGILIQVFTLAIIVMVVLTSSLYLMTRIRSPKEYPYAGVGGLMKRRGEWGGGRGKERPPTRRRQ